tara:strand:- start:31911 stop:32384 length:474 start_codon:yes stop_codon:yes gene_type:complete
MSGSPKGLRATIRMEGPLRVVDVPSAELARLGIRGHVQLAGTLDGQPFEGHLAPSKGGGGRLYIDAAMRRATGKDQGDTLTLAELRVDSARPDPDMPAELERALSDRPGGWEDFERLPDGLRRQMLAYVGDGKRAPTRETRSTQVLAMLDERRRKGL